MTTQPISQGTDVKAALLDALQQSPEPLTAAELRKLLPGEKKPTAGKLGPVLEQMVASSEACRFDPIKGKAIRYWIPGRDEHAAVTEQLRDAVQRAEAPRTAKELLGDLPSGKKPKVAKIEQLLEALVASGEFHRFDPVKDNLFRYWGVGRDEHAAVKEQLRDAVGRAEVPRTAKQLLADMPSGKKPPVAKVEHLLEARVASGELHRFAPAKGKDVRYWDRGPAEYARQIVVATLAKGKGTARAPLTFLDLRKAVKSQLEGASEDDLSRLVQDLLDEGRVHKVLNFDDKPDKQSYSTQPPDLREYLKREFVSLYNKYQKAGVPREEVDLAALAYLGASPSARASEGSRAQLQDLEPVILEIFQELRREKFGHTGLVPIHALRRVIKERVGDHAARHDVLDEKIKGLWSGGNLNLLPINDATGVTVEEMNDSIRGAQETWFYLEAKS